MHKLIISHLAEEVWKTNFGIVDLKAKGRVVMTFPDTLSNAHAMAWSLFLS